MADIDEDDMPRVLSFREIGFGNAVPQSGSGGVIGPTVRVPWEAEE